MPLIAWMTAPCRPKKIVPSYMRWMSRSISNGSCPTTHSASPRQILCDSGASTIALATSDDESTSPTPTMPASVWTLTTSVSWLPSQRSLTSGRRSGMASTLVIFMSRRSLFAENGHDNRSLPRMNVAFDVEHLLPGAQDQLALADRHGDGRAEH